VEVDENLEPFVDEYMAGNLSRRELMKRAVALGVSMSTLATVLAAGARAGTQKTLATGSAGARQITRGGTLLEGYDLDFSRLDPIATNWYDPAFNAIYDAVVTVDANGNYVPQLAEKWEISSDQKTITFHIKPGLKFQNGDPLDAAAIKADFDTIANPKSGSPLRSLWVPAVAKTEAPNKTTLVLKLNHPYYEVLNVIRTGYWRIANMKVRTTLGTKYGEQNAVGSGPFQFVDWVPGSHTSVKRWDGYPGSIVPYFSNKGAAYLDGIRWLTILEAAQRAIQLEQGQINTLRGPAYQDVARLQSNKDIVVVQHPDWSGYVVGLNFESTDLGFNDLRVRQAISAAIDREGIVKTILFGYGEPLYGPVPSQDFAYTKAVERYNRFNLQKAAALLDAAGWKVGKGGTRAKNGKKLSFPLIVQNETYNQRIGVAIQGSLQSVGIDAAVQAYDRGTYFNKLFTAKTPAWMFFYQWPEPIDVVTLFVDPANIHGKGPNWANAVVPEVAAAIKAWQRASSKAQLIKAGGAFQVAVAKSLAIVPIVARHAFWAYSKKVHGYQVLPPNLYPYYNDVWLES